MNAATASLLIKAIDIAWLGLAAWENNADAKTANEPAVASLLELRQKITLGLISEERASEEMDILITQLRSYRKSGEARL